MKPESKRRGLVISAVTLITVAFVLGVGSGIHLQLQGGLQVNAVPNDSTVTLDGKKITTGKEIGVNAGEHTLKVSRNGFATQTKKISIKDRENKLEQFYLLTNSDVGEQWLALHPDQATQIEGTGSRAFDKATAAARANNPFATELPLLDPRFRIDAGASEKHPDTPGAVGIYITADSAAGRQVALQLIRDHGYDPSDMEIIFETP